MNPFGQFTLWNGVKLTTALASPRVGSARTRLLRANSHSGFAPATKAADAAAVADALEPSQPRPGERRVVQTAHAAPDVPTTPSSKPPPSASTGTRAILSCGGRRAVPPAPGGHKNAR